MSGDIDWDALFDDLLLRLKKKTLKLIYERAKNH